MSRSRVARADLELVGKEGRATGFIYQAPHGVALFIRAKADLIVVARSERRVDYHDLNLSLTDTSGVLGGYLSARFAQIAGAWRRLLRHADQALRRALQRGGSGTFGSGAVVGRHRKVVSLAVDQRAAANVVLSNHDIALDPKVDADLQGHIEHHARLLVEGNAEDRSHTILNVEGRHFDALRKRGFGRGQLVEIVAFEFEAR